MAQWYDDAWRIMPDTMAVRLSGRTWAAPPHLKLLSYFLFLAGTGMIRRLAVEMPPGHGKSQLVSHWFPVWMLDYDPSARLILSSYEATLAEEWGKEVRTSIEAHHGDLRVRLSGESLAVNRWRTTAKGGMWTVGAGGAITGRRAKMFLIDDPHKNFDEAHSPTIRNRVWNWYTSTARTRMLPGGSIAVVQTRWHEDDLIGRLLQTPIDGMNRWIEVRLPAIAEEDETIETVVGEENAAWLRARGIPLPEWHREQGEPLWPTLTTPEGGSVPWYDLDELEAIRAEVGNYVWAGLYQQRPASPEGELFKKDRWVVVQEAPPGLRMVRRFDLAASAREGADWTAAVLMGRDHQGMTYILDVQRIRAETADVERFLRRVATEDRQKYGMVPVKLEQEPGSSGKSYAKYLCERVLSGFLATAETSTGSKETRALPLASQQQEGRVALVMGKDDRGMSQRPEWFDEFIEECQMFPNGVHDDMVDAASLGYLDLTEGLAGQQVRVKSSRNRRVPELAVGQ
jgi:predicted phage terminase large subunit-like protein